jgi:hypothetical protein
MVGEQFDAAQYTSDAMFENSALARWLRTNLDRLPLYLLPPGKTEDKQGRALIDMCTMLRALVDELDTYATRVRTHCPPPVRVLRQRTRQQLQQTPPITLLLSSEVGNKISCNPTKFRSCKT